MHRFGSFLSTNNNMATYDLWPNRADAERAVKKLDAMQAVRIIPSDEYFSPKQ